MLEVAQHMQNRSIQIQSLTEIVLIRSRQDHLVDAMQHLRKAEQITPETKHDMLALAFARAEYLTSSAEHARLVGEETFQQQFEQAQQAWAETTELAEDLNIPRFISARGWHAKCLYFLGKLDAAYQLAAETRRDAEREGYILGKAAIPILQAYIAIDMGDTDLALRHLEAAQHELEKYTVRRYLSELYRAYGLYYEKIGDCHDAKKAFAKAIDIFERTGMRREKAELEQKLAARPSV
jgi:tetratricopeptide (TPR) repeat protein